MNKKEVTEAANAAVEALNQHLQAERRQARFIRGRFNDRGENPIAMLTFEIISLDAPTKEAAAFQHVASRLGLTPDHFGATVSYFGKEYVITGATVRRCKYPIFATRVSDNKKFRLPARGLFLKS